MLPVSIPDICEVSILAGPDAPPETPPDIVIEIPHGATCLAHLERTKTLVSRYSDHRNDLFFLANTDQGAPEYAAWLADHITNPERVPLPEREGLKDSIRNLASRMKVLTIRALLPRTIVDVNRTWDGDARSAGLTGVVGSFVPETDLPVLKRLHQTYQDVARQAYDLVCGSGGLGLNLHTYAPISLQPVDGEHIADTMKQAYTTDHYHHYPKRPLVELITAPPDEASLAPPGLPQLIGDAYARIGVTVCENDPFTLHPSTSAYVFSKRHPGKILLMEISRAELADPFDPFVEMNINPHKTARMTRPLASAIMSWLVDQ